MLFAKPFILYFQHKDEKEHEEKSKNIEMKEPKKPYQVPNEESKQESIEVSWKCLTKIGKERACSS